MKQVRKEIPEVKRGTIVRDSVVDSNGVDLESDNV